MGFLLRLEGVLSKKRGARSWGLPLYYFGVFPLKKGLDLWK